MLSGNGTGDCAPSAKWHLERQREIELPPENANWLSVLTDIKHSGVCPAM